MNKRYPLMCYDVVFKTLFSNHLNLLARLLSDITNKSIEEISKNN